MISFIRGTLVEKTPARIVIERDGIGYEIFIPLSSYEAVGDVGSEVKLYTHFYVREDQHTLFGFSTAEEKKAFQMLISVSGIGPRLAMGILSGVSVEDLYEAISGEKVDILTAITGIGRKTAKRLIVELKSKVDEERLRVAVTTDRRACSTSIEEAIQALIALGFTRQLARQAVDKCLSELEADKDEIGVEELVRNALKYI